MKSRLKSASILSQFNRAFKGFRANPTDMGGGSLPSASAATAESVTVQPLALRSLRLSIETRQVAFGLILVSQAGNSTIIGKRADPTAKQREFFSVEMRSRLKRFPITMREL